MTPQELHESIIYLALQGKLTEQRDDDGSGEELLRRYLNNEYNEPNNAPFEIPQSWKWVLFSSIADFRMGKTPARSEHKYWTSDIPWVSIADMIPYGHITKTREGISALASREIFKGVISPAGTLIMSFKLTVGRVSILDIDAYHNEAIISIYPKLGNDNTLRNYLYYLLPTISTFGQTKSAIKGQTLNKDSISKLPIPLPPLAEQKRIVEKIESLMPLVDEYERVWNELESLNRCFPGDLEKSVLQLAFGGKLVKQLREEGDAITLYETILKTKCANKQNSNPPAIESEEVPFEIPQSWKWVRWGDLAESIQYGYNAPAKTKGRIKMVRISDIHDDSVDWPNVPWCDIPESDIASYLLKKNDILFARTGGTVGKAFLVRDDPEPSVYAGYLIRTRYNSELIDPEFLRYFMDSSLYWSQLRDGTIATAQPNCNGKTLSKMMLPLPPLGEQHRIVAELNNVFSILKGLHYGSEENK